MPHPWTLSKIWDEAFVKPEREMKPRNYLYASEVGYSMADNYLKMKGTPPSNTFTLAAQKKMEAGKVFEACCVLVLRRCGILKSSQLKVDYALPGCIEVHGKIDALAGGEVDLDQAQLFHDQYKFMLTDFGFPEVYFDIADRVLEMVKSMDESTTKIELAEYVYEIKSVSQFVWDILERQKKAMVTHRMQNFHYVYGLNKEGRINYVNREDVRLMEFVQYPNGDEMALYKPYVEQMTDYVRSDTRPPLEPLITFNADALKFNKNTVGVEWSKYLTMLYGFTSPTAYRESIGKTASDIDRVFQRCIKNEKITPANMIIIKEAKLRFPEWDNMVDLGKLRKTIATEEEAPVTVDE